MSRHRAKPGGKSSMRPHTQKTKSPKDVTRGPGEPETNQSLKALSPAGSKTIKSEFWIEVTLDW